jgi:hypothetical protein
VRWSAHTAVEVALFVTARVASFLDDYTLRLLDSTIDDVLRMGGDKAAVALHLPDTVRFQRSTYELELEKDMSRKIKQICALVSGRKWAKEYVHQARR